MLQHVNRVTVIIYFSLTIIITLFLSATQSKYRIIYLFSPLLAELYMYMLHSSLLCNHKSFQIKVYFCSLLQEYYVSIGVCVCDHYHVVTVRSNYNPPHPLIIS